MQLQRSLLGGLGVMLALGSLALALPGPADAIPYFARKFDTGCATCHTVVPKLNQTGLDFRERGYRLPGREMHSTIPLSAWVSGRYENRPDADVDSVFLDKVEIISGGALSDRASYFAEWRAVSLGLQDNGELSDRSGRFEDLFVAYDLTDALSLTAGQFRLFNQFDSSLSESTPLALNAGIPGVPEAGDSLREASLRGFSPAGRSPSLMLTYHAPPRDATQRAADGWYVHATVPFPGELSIPLTDEARDRASFELDFDPKGVYLESYYRKGLSSIGGAVFVGDDRQLYTGLASYDPGTWNTTLAVSAGVIDGDSDRRLSWWTELQPAAGVNVGFRLDERSSGPTAYHLYTDLQLPSKRGILWLLVEQRFRSGSDQTVVQLNAVF